MTIVGGMVKWGAQKLEDAKWCDYILFTTVFVMIFGYVGLWVSGNVLTLRTEMQSRQDKEDHRYTMTQAEMQSLQDKEDHRYTMTQAEIGRLRDEDLLFRQDVNRLHMRLDKIENHLVDLTARVEEIISIIKT